VKIAVIGGGAAGIAAAHRSAARGHDVTLFESASTLGGHAHTVEVDDPSGPIAVDTAFLVYNALHYPRFVSFVRELGVEAQTCPAEMSASFVDDDDDFRYALLRGAGGLFCQPRNLVRRSFYRLFADLVRFRARAHRDVTSGAIRGDVTLDEYLAPYSPALREHFVVPLAAAIWSLPDEHVLRYPARAILAFFENHGLLAGTSGDAWRTFRGGSRVYVDAFAKRFRGTVHLGARVSRVARSGDGVLVSTPGGAQRFDAAVMATHADTALALVDRPTSREAAILGAFRYHPTTVTLHEDASVLHPDKRLRASWNTVRRRGKLRITYVLNRVQPLATKRELLLTLGDVELDPARVLAAFSYRHPIFDAAAVGAQAALPSLDGGRVSFCGSYAGHGFHEDAVVAAERVVAALPDRFERACIASQEG
jgi:predicted NAD/FAD-binding protein